MDRQIPKEVRGDIKVLTFSRMRDTLCRNKTELQGRRTVSPKRPINRLSKPVIDIASNFISSGLFQSKEQGTGYTTALANVYMNLISSQIRQHVAHPPPRNADGGKSCE